MNGVDVRGRVYDPQGRAIPHATISFRLLPAGARKTVQADAHGSARFYGGDASIRRGFGRYVDGSAAVSYTWAEDLKLDEPVIGIPPLRGDIGLTLHSASGRMAIQAESILDDRQNRVATSRFEIPTAGYAIFNLEGFYEITSHWTFRAGVDNLLNRYYWDHLDAIDPYTHQPIPEIGRNVKVGFEYSF
jgi:iron complex outermembrane recepter protein